MSQHHGGRAILELPSPILQSRPVPATRCLTPSFVSSSDGSQVAPGKPVPEFHLLDVHSLSRLRLIKTSPRLASRALWLLSLQTLFFP